MLAVFLLVFVCGGPKNNFRLQFRSSFNPFKTDKTAANGNLRLCLKWKPQVKCR